MTTERVIKYKRKGIPKIRHGDLIDYTTWPLHSKPNGRPIETCPKCGRKGERTRYSSGGGGVAFTHSTEFQTIFWFVRESCHIADEVTP